VGKQVCFIANLPPRTMRGIVSEGMILSAEDNEGKLSLLTVTPTAKPGSEIK
jgi:methionyl-tRNA synthetase